MTLSQGKMLQYDVIQQWYWVRPHGNNKSWRTDIYAERVCWDAVGTQSTWCKCFLLFQPVCHFYSIPIFTKEIGIFHIFILKINTELKSFMINAAMRPVTTKAFLNEPLVTVCMLWFNLFLKMSMNVSEQNNIQRRANQKNGGALYECQNYTLENYQLLI